MAKNIKRVEQPRNDYDLDDKTMTEIAADLAAGTAALFARTAVVSVATGLGAGGVRPKAATSVKKAAAKRPPKKAAKKSKEKPAKKTTKKTVEKSTKKRPLKNPRKRP